jgi:type I restriction enzyme S subunit
VLPARALFNELDERGHPDEQLLSVTIAQGVIEQRALLAGGSKKDSSNEDKAAYKLVTPGDITYNKMRAWQGAIGLSEHRGIVSPAYVVMRPRLKCNARYFHYLLRIPAFAAEAERRSYGITSDQWSLRPEHFKMIRFPVPPVAEQVAIARFLNSADRRIRRAIRAKQELIGLLNEHKQAVIHRAVTRGLDPNVRLTPSDVDWLGDLPADWEVPSLGLLVELVTGFPFKSEGFTQNETDVRLLRGVNVAPGSVRWDTTVRWPASDGSTFTGFEVEPGDIVMGMDRPIVSTGMRVALVGENDVPALLVQRVARIRPRGRLDVRFALLLFGGKTFADYLAPLFTGISVPHVSPEQIRSFRVPLPPLSEQQAIADYVEDTTAAIVKPAKAAERAIDYLREYRMRLITDVVTGKLDVRAAASQLPDELVEPEPLDEFDVDQDYEPEADELEAVEA